jgi:lysophospholipase L1-like esterase
MNRINKAKILLFILAVGMCFLVMTGRYTTASQITPSPHLPLPSSPKVVFFGSSTTFGVGATRGDRRWTTLLSRYLGWQEINEGLSGSTLTKYPRAETSLWDIPGAVQRWPESVGKNRPDLVVMMYGVNDAYRRIPLGSSTQAGTFQGDLKTLMAGLRSLLPPDRLIVSTPQPNVATKQRRTPYDLALQEGARAVGAYFIDAGRSAFSSSDLPDYAADGLHPNNLGHAALASFMAGKMVDLGLVAPPPAAEGGNEVAGKVVPLPGGYLRIDLDNPLKFGEIQAIEAQWVAPGNAVLAVMRPSGRGGYEVLYRTSVFAVKPGKARVTVPRWWVLDGDRLAVWTQGDCLGAEELPNGTAHHVSVNAGIRDVTADAVKLDYRRLAIRTIAP